MTININEVDRLPEDFVVFFCWQSHLNPQEYRFLIRGALSAAIDRIQSELPPECSCIIRLDSDTSTRSGTVDIADTILHKIRSSTAVVADVTPVLIDLERERYYPNPNVMIEVGFAAGTVGWHRTICLYENTDYQETDLPFDIRHRRVTGFRSRGVQRKDAKNELEGKLYVALREIIKSIGRGEIDPTLTDHHLKRQRDLRLLRDVMLTLNSDAFDIYIDMGLRRLLYYNILFYWEGFKALIDSSEFRFYDTDLKNLVELLARYWGTAVDTGSMLYSPGGNGNYVLKSEQLWGTVDSERYESHMSSLQATHTTLAAFLDYVHQRYPEIDLRLTNAASRDSIRRYLIHEQEPVDNSGAGNVAND